MAVVTVVCAVVAMSAGRGTNRGLPTDPSVDAQCSARHQLTPGQPAIGTLRFPLALDGGRLTAAAPAPDEHAVVSASRTLEEFESTAEVAGIYRCTTFGLARVTTKVLDTTGVRSESRLAWLGVAAFPVEHCPLIFGNPVVQPEPVNGVILDAGNPHRVEVYTSTGRYCAQPLAGPTLGPAHQVLSVPFQAQDFGLITYELPLCATAFEPPRYSLAEDGPVGWVHVAVPFGREDCGARRVTVSTGEPYDIVLNARHAPPGPAVVLDS